MKKIILNASLLLLFVFGSIATSAGNQAEFYGGGTTIAVITLKQSIPVFTLDIPAKYLDQNNDLISPLNLELYATNGSRKVLLSLITKDLNIDLSAFNLTQGDYIIQVNVGDFVKSKEITI